MKLTFTWNNSTGECRVSKADLARLRDGYDGRHIAELDFLQDCLGILQAEYNSALELFNKKPALMSAEMISEVKH